MIHFYFSGPFAACNRVMNPQWFFDNCLSDVCADYPNTDHFCDTLDDLAARCALIGVPAENWRHDVPKCGKMRSFTGVRDCKYVYLNIMNCCHM